MAVIFTIKYWCTELLSMIRTQSNSNHKNVRRWKKLTDEWNPKKPEMHFLLLGMTHEHILVEIKALALRHAVIFTSENLLEDAQEFSRTLERNNVAIHEIICVSPFEPESIEVMTNQILAVSRKYSPSYSIVCGLTGGTNLMVSAMTMAAFLAGLPCHYSMQRETNPVIKVDYLQKKHDEVFGK